MAGRECVVFAWAGVGECDCVALGKGPHRHPSRWVALTCIFEPSALHCGPQGGQVSGDAGCSMRMSTEPLMEMGEEGRANEVVLVSCIGQRGRNGW